MTQRITVSTPIALDAGERALLTEWAQSETMRMRLRERARIVLAAADGASYRAISAELGISRDRVALWCTRFRTGGIEGLATEKPRIRSPKANAAKIAEIVELATQTGPTDATQWNEFALEPHDSKTFMLADDVRFADRLEAIVGLHLSPPEHTLVLCCDGGRGVRSTTAAQPGPSSKDDHNATKATADRRDGIAPLLAALRRLDEIAIEDPKAAHRHHAEWLGFLRWIHRLTPQDKVLHLICDNRVTYGRSNVKAWFKKHPRFHIHFTPASTPWLNTVERFFSSMDDGGLSRGVLQSIDDLVASIPDYIIDNDTRPRPFVWTAKADDILKKDVSEPTEANRKG